MNPIETILRDAANKLPDCHEKSVILTMLGNRQCGATNEPLANLAVRIAGQMLKDLES